MPTRLGVSVHLVGALTGLPGVGLVYLLARHEFTRRNARNAANWHLVCTPLVVGSVLVVRLLGPRIGVFVALPLMAAAVALAVTFACTYAATTAALGGIAWEYPVVPRVL